MIICPDYVSEHEPASCEESSYSTTPTCGLIVVNGYAATTGLAREMARSRLDLPALGKPTCGECIIIIVTGADDTMIPTGADEANLPG